MAWQGKARQGKVGLALGRVQCIHLDNFCVWKTFVCDMWGLNVFRKLLSINLHMN